MSEKANNSALAKALLAAQKEVLEKTVVKDATNPHFGNAYAKLESVIDVVIGALNKQGVTVLQFPTNPPFEGTLALTTTLLHESGESVSGTLVIPLEKQNAQGIGSAISYGRRYSLAAVIGLKQEDDDGEGAVDADKRATSAKKPNGLQPPKPGGGKPLGFLNKGGGGKPAGNAKPPQRGKAGLFPKVNQENEGGGEEESDGGQEG